MAENLNFSASSGSVCYDNLESNCAIYGKLYTWAAANTSCPNGWHLPSIAEWDKLSRYIDGNTGTSKPYSSTTAGGKLKAKSGWSSGNGTDDFGFEALPGGDSRNGTFSNKGSFGKWWSSENPYRRTITHTTEAGWDYSDFPFLYSVRCIQGD
jgi:uncharacterized protein (TIGR02145 family)